MGTVAAHLHGLWDDVRAERHLDAAGRGAANGHVEENDRVGHCEVFGVCGVWVWGGVLLLRGAVVSRE